MTSEEIISWARYAGLIDQSFDVCFEDKNDYIDSILIFFNVAFRKGQESERAIAKFDQLHHYRWGQDVGAKNEREECAKVCEKNPEFSAKNCADAIRSMGKIDIHKSTQNSPIPSRIYADAIQARGMK